MNFYSYTFRLTSQHKDMQKESHGFGIALGVSLGAAIGAALGNVAIGMAIGVVAGVILEAVRYRDKK